MFHLIQFRVVAQKGLKTAEVEEVLTVIGNNECQPDEADNFWKRLNKAIRNNLETSSSVS